MPEEAQVNLRADLSHEIATAQSALAGQLAELERAGDSALVELLRGQLHTLHTLGDMVHHAKGNALAQIRAEVNTSVAAARSIAQQAQTSLTTAHLNEAAHRAEYERATAELDRRSAPALALDRENNALAHALADRQGIDLSAYDRERAELAQQRARAVEAGDIPGKRRADVLMAENTLNTMAAGLEGITDPDERNAYLLRMQAQQRGIDELRAAYEAQLELEARKEAREHGLSPEATTVKVAQQKAAGMARLDEQAGSLVGAEQGEAMRSMAMVTLLKSAADAKVKAAPALNPMEASLTPEAQAQTQKAIQAVIASDAAYASTVTLEGIGDPSPLRFGAASPVTKGQSLS